MNKNIYFVIVMLVIVISSVTAVAFPQNSNASIKHAIRVDGAVPAAASCNISIYYPNSSILVDFQPMDDNNNYFSYNLSDENTSLIGKYTYDVTCVSGSLNKTDSFEYYINPGGVEPSESKTQAITRSIYVIAAIGVLLFIGFLFTKENITFKFTFFLLSLLFFLISINLIFISLQDEVVSVQLQDFFSGFTAISFYLYWFLGFLIFVIWIITFLNTMIIKKNAAKIRKYGGDI